MARKRIEDGSPMSLRTQFRRRKEQGLCKNVKKHFFNESFFLNKSKEFWWLSGLVWSDGNLYHNTIEICSKDLSLLEIVKKIISHKSEIQTKNNGKHYRIIFSSKNVANIFKGMGLTPCKSFTIKMPIIKSNIMMWHFVRGVFDGDGCVNLSQTRKSQAVFDLRFDISTASKSFANDINSFFQSQKIRSNIRVTAKNKNPVYRVYVVEQKSLIKLYKKIYVDSEQLRLNRKHYKYTEWINKDRVKVGRVPAMPFEI